MACMCGHVEDEHGSDPEYPGSTACTIDGCKCVAYDPDVDDQEQYALMESDCPTSNPGAKE